MRRHAIGIIAIGLLAAALGFWATGTHQAVEFAFLRVGAVLAVLWVAYPDLRRLPAWMLVAAPVVLTLVALRPRRFLILLPILIAVAVLRPRRR
ncbi:MAG: hypothetical protein JW809_01430 [Pirellulales bacterium]|nr:hypothetical protein [Pirellulales bacterium]